MLQFNNPEVAAKYKSSFKGNPTVHVPGKGNTGFKCKLADISLENADKLFKVPNQNLLQLNANGNSQKSVEPKPVVEKPVPGKSKSD